MSDFPERIWLSLDVPEYTTLDPTNPEYRLYGYEETPYIRADLIPLDIQAAIEEADNQQQRIETWEKEVAWRDTRIEELERHNQSLADDFQRFYDGIPWEQAKIACYEEFSEPEDRADYAVTVLERILALREQSSE